MSKLSPFWMISFLLGVSAFKEIDFANFCFKHTGLGILYSLTFILSVVLILVDRKKVKDNSTEVKTDSNEYDPKN